MGEQRALSSTAWGGRLQLMTSFAEAFAVLAGDTCCGLE